MIDFLISIYVLILCVLIFADINVSGCNKWLALTINIAFRLFWPLSLIYMLLNKEKCSFKMEW